MKLSDLDKYNTITIQCHDNPDADTIGSGYGLYCYFKKQGRDVRLIYSGYSCITKANLKLMIETLDIPIEYVPLSEIKYVPGLLITVDCQYGSGNVSKLEADTIAVVDHHPTENDDIELRRIQPNLGSCSTLIWCMLREAGFEVDEDEAIGTALYYGLYMDTNQFTELFNPLDMDMCESVTVNMRLMNRYRNTNISLEELEIAGLAMHRYTYNDDYRFAVIKSKPCDSNLLGLISDFLLQVAEIDTCVVYNERTDGYKLSVRSCVKEVNANELAVFLTDGIGSGGGHLEKAGGFISKKLYEEKYPTTHSEAYVNSRMVEYFDTFEIIHAKDMKISLEEFSIYRRCSDPVGYLCVDDLFKPGVRISLRSNTGNREIILEEGSYIVMERDGFVQTMSKERFEKCMEESPLPMPDDYCEKMEYIPIIKDLEGGKTYLLSDHVKIAVPKETYFIYAKELNRSVKLFPKWDDDKYMLGVPGDYLTVRGDDIHNICIERANEFKKKFMQIH